MPPGHRPPPPAHTARFAFEGQTEASPWANVLYLRNGGQQPPDQTDMQLLANFLYAAWGNTVLENLTATTTLDRCSVLYWLPSGDVLGSEAVGTDKGDFADPPYPANVSCVISWTIQQHYRGGKPRTYLPGVPSSQFADNTTFQASWIAAVQNSARQFHRDVNGYSAGQFSDVHLGTVSFVFEQKWRTPPVFRDFTLDQATVDSRIDSQRRRLGPDRV